MTAKRTSPGQQPPADQSVSEDTLLKITKEIAVKFIEVGRLTPATFDETFKSIHLTVREATQPDD
jgi:hypothetical protein